MGLTKYTAAEKTEVLSPEEHEAIEENLHLLAKTSGADLSVDERKIVFEPASDSTDD